MKQKSTKKKQHPTIRLAFLAAQMWVEDNIKKLPVKKERINKVK